MNFQDQIPNFLHGVARLTAVPMVLAAVWLANTPLAAAQTTEEMIKAGEKVFRTVAEIGCASCHGDYAEGDKGIGPYNRGVGEEKIRAAINSIEAMEFLKEEIHDREIKQIAAYYYWLGELQLVKTLAKRGRFIPDSVQVYPGTKIQLVINNSSPFPRSFASGNMGIKPLTVPGRESSYLVWDAPQEERVFTLSCTNCRIKDQALSIEITKSARKHFSPSAGKVAAAAKAPAKVAAVRPPVIADRQAIELGRELFLTAGEVGCVACHGPYAEGDVGIGPYNRGFSESKIRRAIAKVPVMRFLAGKLSDKQIKQVASYYHWLGGHKLVKTVTVGGRVFPARIQLHPGTPIQLVIANRDRKSHEFKGPVLGTVPIRIGARDAGTVAWVAPATEGHFTIGCSDCSGKSAKLTIEVTKKAGKFVPNGGN